VDIFLVRHCQSVGNRRRTIQGWHDSPLTEKGREQARLLADRLAECGIERLYSSPLSRALETARVISEVTGNDVVVIDLLKEIDVGAAEEHSIDEVERLYPREVSDLTGKKSGSASFPGGETLDAFHRRSGELWRFLTAGDQPGVVACVSHGWMLNALLKRALALPLDSRNRVFPNGAVQHLRSENRHGPWEVVSAEYIEHETPPMRVWQLF
jgi:broad specificity phosphatase PhoE